MKYTKIWLTLVALISLFSIGYLLYIHDLRSEKPGKNEDLNPNVVLRTYNNYFDQVKVVSAQFDIDPAFLLALIALESSGRKIVPRRFEQRVFQRLKSVRDGESDGMEFVTTEDLRKSNDAALRNLASSWGPYQLMGYKCIQLGVKVSDIRGNEALYHGAKWIRHEYGHLLDEKRFKDAFHYHNTGSNYPSSGGPRTHDKNYVPKGLGYMISFNELIASQ